MSKSKGKKAFVPAQAAADLAALDFDAALEIFNRAEGRHLGGTQDFTGIDEAASSLLAIPAQTAGQLAQKIRAFAYLSCGRQLDVGNLNDVDERRRIATVGETADKALLAIYLDVTGLPVSGPLVEPSPGLDTLARDARDRYAAWEAGCSRTDEVLADAEGREVTEQDRAEVKQIREAWEASLDALRSYPVNSAAEAAFKQRALAEASYTQDEEDLKANLDAALADIDRLSENRATMAAADPAMLAAIQRALEAHDKLEAADNEADWPEANECRTKAVRALRDHPAATLADALRKQEALEKLSEPSFIDDVGGDLDAAVADIRRLLNSEPADRSEWEQAVFSYEAAHAAVAALSDDATDEVCDPILDAEAEAIAGLLNTRAPDVGALVFKARLILGRAYAEFKADHPDRPGMIHRMLNGTWEEHFAAAAYQDALYMSGDRGPIATLVTEPFRASDWAKQVEVETGAQIGFDGDSVTFNGRTAGEVYFAWSALADWKKQLIEEEAARQQRRREGDARREANQTTPATPEHEAEVRAMLIHGLFNCVPDDVRWPLADALEAVGLDITVPASATFDAARFMAELIAAQMTVIRNGDEWSIYTQIGGDRGEPMHPHPNAAAMEIRFRRLRPEQRDALGAYIEGQRQ